MSESTVQVIFILCIVPLRGYDELNKLVCYQCMGLHTAQLVKHCSALSAELALLVQILSKSINLLFFTWNLQLLKYCCYCMRWLHPHLNLLLNWHTGKELSSVMIWLKKKSSWRKTAEFLQMIIFSIKQQVLAFFWHTTGFH